MIEENQAYNQKIMVGCGVVAALLLFGAALVAILTIIFVTAAIAVTSVLVILYLVGKSYRDEQLQKSSENSRKKNRPETKEK